MVVTYLQLIMDMMLDVFQFLIYMPSGEDPSFSFFPFYLLIVLSLLLVGVLKKVLA